MSSLRCILAIAAAASLSACSDDGSSAASETGDATAAGTAADDGDGGDGNDDGDDGQPTAGDTAADDDGLDDDTGADDDTGGGPPTAAGCGSLPPARGEVIAVAPGEDLAAAVANAPTGSTILLAAGTYMIDANGLWIGADGVTLRSASDNRDDVILDGNYQQASGGIVNIAGRTDVTIAHLTIQRSRYHTVHVTGGPEGPSIGARLYDLHLVDPGEQTVKVNSNYDFDTDAGELACSHLELTDAGRAQVMSYESSGSFCYTGGIDAHRARDWVVRDNVIEGFWCSNEFLSEHAIHFWRGCRDTIVERNTLIDNARGIGFGLGTPADGRTYDDDPCPGVPVAEHYGGVIRNNMIVGTRPELFASPSGMDIGIGLEAACGATIVHNTVASAMPPYSSIEWRWPETTVDLVNNLVTHNLRERDGAVAMPAGNLEMADPALFVDMSAHDLHLKADAAAAIDQGDASGSTWTTEDFDGDARDAAPDIGADEIAP